MNWRFFADKKLDGKPKLLGVYAYCHSRLLYCAALWNNLPIILHHADHMASRIEYENWKNGNTVKQAFNSKPKFTKKPSPKKLSTTTQNNSAQDMFKDLFGEA